MPLVPGGTLRDRLARGPLEVDETLALGVALARSAGRAHERGIVHRDLKPENVLFREDGRPLVADLGLAKHWSHDGEAARSVALSKTGQLRGTAQYMAPEQAQDARSVGPPADVFALGAVLWECLAGRPAFEGDNVLEVLTRVAGGEIPDVREHRPEVPAWLADVLARALDPDPAKRWRDGHALAGALAGHAPGVSARTRRLAKVALAVAVVGSGVAAGAVYARARQTAREVDALLAGAEAALRRHEAPAARDLDRALALAPGSARAWLDRALAHDLARERDAALADGTRALALAPEDPRTLAVVASLEEALGKSDAAATHAALALARDPFQPRALRVRGGQRLEQTDATARLLGTSELARAIALAPDDAVAWRLFAHGLLLVDERRTGASERGIEAASRAIALDPRLAGAWADRALANGNRGDHKRALPDFDRALALEPDNATTLANRACSRAQTGDLAGAVADAERALAIDRKRGAAHVALAVVAAEKKDRAAALLHATRALECEPDNTVALYYRARARYSTGDKAGALRDADELVRLLPDDPQVRAHRGELRDVTGDARGAIEDYGRAIELDPRHARTWFLRGKARDGLEPGSGRDDLDRAVTLDPELVDAWVLLQRDLLRAGDDDAAMKSMDRALPYFQGNSGFQCERAALLSRVGRVPESEAEFAAAVAREDRNPDVFVLRGTTRLDRGELETAIVDFDRALALDRTKVYALCGRARAFALRGEFDRAIADASEATRQAPKRAVPWAYLSLCRLQARDARAAFEAARRAAAVEPDNPFALAVRGLARAELGETGPARQDLELAFLHRNESFVRDLIGRLAQRKLDELKAR